MTKKFQFQCPHCNRGFFLIEVERELHIKNCPAQFQDPNKRFKASRLFVGLLLEESLKDKSIFLSDDLRFKKEKVWENVKNAVEWQPKDWTPIYFMGNAGNADAVAELLSKALKSRWYTNFSTKDTVYVVFSGKIFKYKKGDTQKREEAIAFGRAIGVPESQLDWDENLNIKNIQ